MRVSVLLIVLITVAGCATQNNTIMQTPAEPTPWRIVYNDGSGNGYRFWQEAEDDSTFFSFDPIKPEFSSSGTYDGGEPNKGSVEPVIVAELWKSVRELEATGTDYSISKRTMGSGAFDRRTPAGSRKFLVRRGPELMAFDKFLDQFRGK